MSSIERNDVFISYSTADSKLAKNIKDLIEKELNLGVFFSEENLGQVTDDWKKDIITNIKNSKCFIPLNCKKIE